MRRDDVRSRFEQQRLTLFAAHGFAGQSRCIADAEGRRTYAITRGQGPSPTLLVHGGIGVGAEWALLAARLTAPLVIADRPGYGLSYPMDYRKVDVDRHAADWLLGVVNGLGVPRVNLIGASMGGLFAMAFATAHPERVRLLALVGASPGLDRAFPLFLRLYANPIIGRLIARIDLSDPETLRARAFSAYLTHPERVPLDLLRVAAAGGVLPGTPLTARTLLNAVATTLGGQRPEVFIRDDMARLGVPTQFVWGDHDSVMPAADGEDLAYRMADAKITVIEDAGHMPHLDQPDAVAAALNARL